MPPKTAQGLNQAQNDIEEMKNSLNFLTEEVSKLSKKQDILAEMVNELKNLKVAVIERDQKIADMEKRLNDLEQYSRMEDIIISGLNIKPRSYAKAAAASRSDGEDAAPEDQQSLEEQLITFFKTKKIDVDPNSIAACHTLPTKVPTAKPPVIVRFVNRKHKDDLLRQGKKLKGSDVYVNEHLTKRNGDIARAARALRKQKKIQSTWTRSCKVMIKLNGETPEDAKVFTVRDVKELDKYK